MTEKYMISELRMHLPLEKTFGLLVEGLQIMSSCREAGGSFLKLDRKF